MGIRTGFYNFNTSEGEYFDGKTQCCFFEDSNIESIYCLIIAYNILNKIVVKNAD